MTRRPWEWSTPPAELLSLLNESRVPNRHRGLGGAVHQHDQHTQHAAQAAGLSEAVRRFHEAHPILELLERFGAGDLRRVASTNGGEWAGPCPVCGGRDRFRVWPGPPEGAPRAWCRQCRASGDTLSWATRFAGRDPRVIGATGATLREHGLLQSPSARDSPPARVVGLDSTTRSECELAETTLSHTEQFEERAAIMEYDGGLSRDEAEALVLRYARSWVAITHEPGITGGQA